MRLEPEYIPRILLSTILFGLGASVLLASFTGPSCLCPLILVGQQPPPPTPFYQSYQLWGIIVASLLIGTSILILVLPRDKPAKRTRPDELDVAVGPARVSFDQVG